MRGEGVSERGEREKERVKRERKSSGQRQGRCVVGRRNQAGRIAAREGAQGRGLLGVREERKLANRGMEAKNPK